MSIINNEQIDTGHRAICGNCNRHFDLAIKITKLPLTPLIYKPNETSFDPPICPYCRSIIQGVTVYDNGTIIANVKEV